MEVRIITQLDEATIIAGASGPCSKLQEPEGEGIPSHDVIF